MSNGFHVRHPEAVDTSREPSTGDPKPNLWEVHNVNYSISNDDGSESTATPEEFSKQILGPLADPEHIASKQEIGDALARWRSATYGKGCTVEPDVADVRQSETWFASVSGTPLDQLSGESYQKGRARVMEHAAQVAQERNNSLLKSISGRIASASQRHDDQWAAHDAETNGDQYERALAELEAEDKQLSARERLADRIMSIADDQRRAAWVERFPNIFSE